MSLFSRMRSIWYAILNSFVSGLEDKHVVELAEAKLQEATERLKEGRDGLATYQSLVLKVQGQVDEGKRRIDRLTAEIKSHLRAGNEQVAAQLALELQGAKNDYAANSEQLKLHQEAYENNLVKMKQALKDINAAKNELEKKKASLKMERALAEVAETAGALNANLDLSSDFGGLMSKLDDQINKSKAKAKVAADLSGDGVEMVKAKQAAEQQMARDLLDQFKIEEGLMPAPVREAAPAATPEKTMGPARQTESN